jgi:hypothetical protein
MHPWRQCGNTLEAHGIWWKGEAGRPGASACLAPSGVFYTLLMYVSSQILLVIIDILILFLLFSGINPINL